MRRRVYFDSSAFLVGSRAIRSPLSKSTANRFDRHVESNPVMPCQGLRNLFWRWSLGSKKNIKEPYIPQGELVPNMQFGLKPHVFQHNAQSSGYPFGLTKVGPCFFSRRNAATWIIEPIGPVSKQWEPFVEANPVYIFKKNTVFAQDDLALNYLKKRASPARIRHLCPAKDPKLRILDPFSVFQRI